MTRRIPQWLTIVSYFANEAAAQRKDERHFRAEERHRQWERCFGRLSLSLTFCTTVAAIAAAGFAGGAWIATQGQLKAMQDEQRPWLKPILTITGSYATISTPVNAQTEAGSMSVSAQAENVGHAPAFNIHAFLWPTPGDGPGATPGHGLTCTDIADRRLNRLRADTGVVFPGDISALDNLLNRVSWSNNELLAGDHIFGPGRPSVTNTQINFCIDYDYGQPPTLHYSSSLFQLVQRTENPGGDWEIPIHGIVPKDRLELLQITSGAN